ncbi:MAG: hypothetical protein JW760_15540 [Spirochaetales bacterium]|nr:hypothetical protein [Spirochaetales bacterium]
MKRWLRYCILVFSMLLLIAGLWKGDLLEGILRKAVNLCYECIGIG